MILEKIDHIGIAVSDLESAVARYTVIIGNPPESFEEVPEQKVRVAMFSVGESRIELLQSTSPDSPIAKFIDKRGEGMHHVCFKVPDLQASLARLADEGLEILPGAGGTGAGGSRVAFLHPKSGNGVLIELVERK
jgi:methylmalonyl-CoA/ethylmalonyl-CoA epimerase